MKCKYGTIWLTGTPWQEDCGEVVWEAGQPVEVTDLIRRATPFISGLGNVAESLPVPVVLELGDELLALDYLAKLPWSLPNNGALRFEEQRGNRTWVCTYASAAWQTAQRKRNGTSVQVVYQFVVAGPPATAIVENNSLVTDDGDALVTDGGQTLIIN